MTLSQCFVIHRDVSRDRRDADVSDDGDWNRKSTYHAHFDERVFDLGRHTPSRQLCSSKGGLGGFLWVTDREGRRPSGQERNFPCLDVESRNDACGEDDADAGDEEGEDQRKLDRRLT